MRYIPGKLRLTLIGTCEPGINGKTLAWLCRLEFKHEYSYVHEPWSKETPYDGTQECGEEVILVILYYLSYVRECHFLILRFEEGDLELVGFTKFERCTKLFFAAEL